MTRQGLGNSDKHQQIFCLVDQQGRILYLDAGVSPLLARRKKDLGLVLRVLGLGFVVINKEGRVAFADKTAAEFLGQPQVDLKGQIIHQLLQQRAALKRKALPEGLARPFPGAAPQSSLGEQPNHYSLTRERLRIYWQPVFTLASSQIAYYELLLRLRNHDGVILEPSLFLPIAHRLGMMPQIDLWVVGQALRLLSNSPGGGEKLRLGVNLSGGHLADAGFTAALHKQLEQSQADLSNLILEITEQQAIGDLAFARRQIRRLQRLGCNFALDDFGVGFASLDLLKQLPVDLVKIDGSFVRNLAHSQVDQRLLSVIVQAVKVLGKESVAEFVEEPGCLHWLEKLGVDHAQGFYLGRPEPAPVPV